MSSIAACNFINKLQFLQSPLHCLPWVKRSLVRCFSTKASDLEKNFPIKYIPKNLQHVNQNQQFSSGDDVPHTTDTVLDRRHRQGSRTDHKQSNVAFDDVHGMCNKTEKHGKGALKTRHLKALQDTVEHVIVPKEVVQELQISKRDDQGRQAMLNQMNRDHNGRVKRECMEKLASDVKEMQLYNVTAEAKQKNSKTCRTQQDAEKVAVQLLAKRALTGVELRKKLTAKKFPVIVVDAVVRDFQSRGLINDRLYAEVYCSSRWKSSSWGPRKIKQELMKKGISEDDVENVVKLVFVDKNCDERSDITLSDSSLQRLYEQSSKQWQRCKKVPHETRKARVIRWLQYRGFDWGVISSILKKLEAECP